MTPVEDEVLKVRDRLHKLSDIVQNHEGMLREHGVRIEVTGRQVDALITQMATRAQLDATALALGEKLSSAMTLMALQIKTIADDIAPLRKGIYWVVTLILGAVIAAILALILRPMP